MTPTDPQRQSAIHKRVVLDPETMGLISAKVAAKKWQAQQNQRTAEVWLAKMSQFCDGLELAFAWVSGASF